MKKMYSLMAVLIMAIVMTGCSSSNGGEKQATEHTNHAKSNGFPVTVKDAAGEEVTIKSKPDRIISLMPSNTEAVFALDRGQHVVGVSDFDNYPEETKDIQKIGDKDINTELILSLHPDLVLAHGSNAHNSSEGLKQLEDAGIPVVVVNDAKSFKEVYEGIEMIGKAIGETKKAEEVVHEMQDKITAIKEQAKSIKAEDKKDVLVEVSPAPDLYTTGKNTFMDEMLAIISANNVAGSQDGWVKMDEEAMIAANPDVIITTYGYYTEDPIGQVTGRKGWKDIKAVKNGEVYDVHSDLVTRSGPRLTEGVEELAKAVYPDIFDK